MDSKEIINRIYNDAIGGNFINEYHRINPIIYYIRKKEYEIVKYLINVLDIDINNNDFYESGNCCSLLIHRLAYSNNLDLVKTAVEKGADNNVFDDMNKSPLDIAFENNNLDMIKYLINCGSCVDKYCINFLSFDKDVIFILEYILDIYDYEEHLDEHLKVACLYKHKHKNDDVSNEQLNNIKWLLDHGATKNNIDIIDIKNMRPKIKEVLLTY